MEKWERPKTIIGSTAEGAYYYMRESIEEKLWEEIEKGNHIRLEAPRRVGKSSVMKYLAKNPQQGFLCVYDDIESDGTSQEFYKRLFEVIIKLLASKEAVLAKFNEYFKKIKITNISTSSIEVGSDSIDYKDLLLKTVEKLKELDIKIVLFLDEFPDVLKAISENESSEKAKEVLHTLRELRHKDEFKQNIVLVLAGSVGLMHIVKNIARPNVIEDMYEINITPLENDEPSEFINQLMDGASMQIKDEQIKYLINKVNHCIPYFLQLMIEACDEIVRNENEGNQLQNEHIDQAYNEILKNSTHFLDWESRLKRYFPDDFLYFFKVLTHIAHYGKISYQELYDLADDKVEYKSKVDDVLVKDGYLKEVNRHYYFVSPFLKDWWANRHPLIQNQ